MLVSVPIKILIYVFLVSSMGSIGLQVSIKDMKDVLVNKKRLLYKILFINFIVIPAIGILCISFVPMTKSVAAAIIILSLSPGGMAGIQFISKAQDTEALAFAGYAGFLLMGLSILISPVLIKFFLPEGLSLVIPYAYLLVVLLFLVILPLILGLLIHEKKGAVAEKYGKLLGVVGLICFVSMVLLTLAARKEAMAAIGTPALLFMIVYILVAMAIGWFSGGPNKWIRHVFAVTTNTRNAALGLLIVIHSFPDSGIVAPLIAYSALMVTPNLVLTVGHIIKDKRKQKSGQKC